MAEWTSVDLRAWRGRLRWTQASAAEALCYHVAAYKNLEYGYRQIVARVRQRCIELERDHVRLLYSASSGGGTAKGFATADAVVARHEALDRAGQLVAADGRRRLRYVALFAGMGGATAAFERIGSDALLLASSDISPGSNALHRFRWPQAPRLGDILDVDWVKLRGLVDLVTFGPPCQSFSMAGKRRGLDDPRGCLVMESLRAIAAMQPKWMVFENVEGFLSFPQALEEFQAAAGELGYKLARRVLDARVFGVPQSRRRLWIVGELGPDTRGPDAVLDFRKSPRRIKVARGEGWRNPPRRFEGGSGDLIMTPGPDFVPVPDPEPAPSPPPGSVLAVSYRNFDVRNVAPCLQTKSNSLNSHPVLLIRQDDGSWRDRNATPTECARLQGYDDGWLDGPKLAGKAFSDTERGRLTGNAWTVQMAAWVLAGVESLFRTERMTVVLDYSRMRPFARPPASMPAAVSAPAANDDSRRGGLALVGGRRSTGDIADMVRKSVACRYLAA